MDVCVSERVGGFLEARGINAEDLPRSVLGRLASADGAIQSRLDAASEAADAMRGSRITVAAIAQDIGVARKTVYNTPLLLEYIKACEAEQGACDLGASEAARLREKNRILSDRLEKMMRRDAETEELKVEIASMAKAVHEKNAQIIALQASNERLRRELADARSKIPPTRGNIIEIGGWQTGR